MLYPLIRFTISHVFPHGITDLIHAKHTHQEKELCLTYLGGLGVSTIYDSMLPLYLYPFQFPSWLPSVYNHLGTIVFFVASTIHFRYDMPRLPLIPRWVLSSCFLAICLQYPLLFLCFISLIHTPHHYIRSWYFIEPYKKETFIFLSILFLGCYQVYPFIKHSNLVYSIIVSHILYEELYIHKKPSFQQLFPLSNVNINGF